MTHFRLNFRDKRRRHLRQQSHQINSYLASLSWQCRVPKQKRLSVKKYSFDIWLVCIWQQNHILTLETRGTGPITAQQIYTPNFRLRSGSQFPPNVESIESLCYLSKKQHPAHILFRPGLPCGWGVNGTCVRPRSSSETRRFATAHGSPGQCTREETQTVFPPRQLW